jgi:hypothetical protein
MYLDTKSHIEYFRLSNLRHPRTWDKGGVCTISRISICGRTPELVCSEVFVLVGCFIIGGQIMPSFHYILRLVQVYAVRSWS